MRNILKKLQKKSILMLITKKSRDSITLKNPISGLKFLLALQNANYRKLLPLIMRSKSQNYQDLFVLSELDMKKKGYFVEFGATNGIDLSNTYLLENDFGWKGILAEPARYWHEALRQNRPSTVIEEACVWTNSGMHLIFNETVNKELSTLDTFTTLDNHRELRQNGEKYDVMTISLEELLDKNNAPKFIDYLSIDTEGSEFEILNSFNFQKYTFGVITCEHNYTAAREEIYKLLISKGYIRKHEQISRWDDWYVKG
jgi:FkbM family methyltransferase